MMGNTIKDLGNTLSQVNQEAAAEIEQEEVEDSEDYEAQ